MADAEQIRKTAVEVLGYVEKAASFASSIDPLFGVVTKITGVICKGLVAEEDHASGKDFKKIHDNLESISEETKKILEQIKIEEVSHNYGKYEEYIKKQYEDYNTMVKCIKEDPASVDRHMEDFKKKYIMLKLDSGLNTYYSGVMGKGIFGRPLLNVYLENCKNDRVVMGHRCSHLIHLFRNGLTCLMAYTSITKGNEDGIIKKWDSRVKEIRAKMEEALNQCKQN